MKFSHDGKMVDGKHILGKGEKRPAASAESVDRFNTQSDNDKLPLNKTSANSIMDKKSEGGKDQKAPHANEHSFGKAVEKGEEAMNVMTQAYAQLMKINASFNTELVELIRNSKVNGSEEMLDLIQSNFEKSGILALESTKKISEWYRKQDELVFSFHERFMDDIRRQTETLVKMQHKGLEVFSEWAFDWWAPSKKENRNL
jgi:hypothetical protein